MEWLYIITTYCTPYWIIDDRSAEEETTRKIPTGHFTPGGSSMITVSDMIDLSTIIYQVNEDIYYYNVY